MTDLPLFTKSQLALRNGQDKPEIWIAFKGLIYDVSNSRLWNNGKHYEHWAGQDLTDELPDAPHTDTVFEKIYSSWVISYLNYFSMTKLLRFTNSRIRDVTSCSVKFLIFSVPNFSTQKEARAEP